MKQVLQLSVLWGFVAIVVATMVFLAAGCSRDAGGAGGEQFIGHWKGVDRPKWTLVIERKGAGYVVTAGHDTSNAVLENGLLKCVDWQNETVAFDKGTGRIMGPFGPQDSFMEFQRDQ